MLHSNGGIQSTTSQSLTYLIQDVVQRIVVFAIQVDLSLVLVHLHGDERLRLSTLQITVLKKLDTVVTNIENSSKGLKIALKLQVVTLLFDRFKRDMNFRSYLR